MVSISFLSFSLSLSLKNSAALQQQRYYQFFSFKKMKERKKPKKAMTTKARESVYNYRKKHEKKKTFAFRFLIRMVYLFTQFSRSCLFCACWQFFCSWIFIKPMLRQRRARQGAKTEIEWKVEDLIRLCDNFFLGFELNY